MVSKNKNRFKRSLMLPIYLPLLGLGGCDGCDDDGGVEGDYGPPTPVQGVAIACVGSLLHAQGGAGNQEVIPFPSGYDPANPSDAVERVQCGYSAAEMAAALQPDHAIQLPPTNLEQLELANTGYCACGTDDTSEWTQGCQDTCEKLLDTHPVYNRANGYSCNTETILAPTGASKGSVCVHGSVVYFNGAPAQYVSGISGNLHSEVHVTIDLPFPIPDDHIDDENDSPFAGTVQYSYADMSDGCGAGCGFVISRIKVIGQDFTLADTPITGLHAVNQDMLIGSIFDDGRFEIPAGTARLVVRYIQDGEAKMRAQPMQKPLTGFVDFATGDIFFDSFSLKSGPATMLFEGFQSHVAASPPAPQFSPIGTVECNAYHSAVVEFDGSATTDPDGDIKSHTWRVDDQNVAGGAIVNLELPLGTSKIRLDVADQREGLGMHTDSVTVVDTTPPEFGDAATGNFTACDAVAERFILAPPVVSDVCGDVMPLEAWLVSTLNEPAFPPRQLDYDAAELSVGEHTILWIARDEFGNESSVEQTVRISPAILGTQSVEVQNRAQALTAAGGLTGIGSTGSNPTLLGVDAKVGEVLSYGPVQLKGRAFVAGDVISGGSILTEGSARIGGARMPFSYVPLATTDWLAPYLGTTFGSGALSVNEGTTVELNGAYGLVEVHNEATVVLTGDVAVTELLLTPGSRLQVAVPDAQLVVRDRLQIVGEIEAAQPDTLLDAIVLGSEAIVGAPVSGLSLIAPNALVRVKSQGTVSRFHLLVGGRLLIESGTTLACDRTSALPL